MSHGRFGLPAARVRTRLTGVLATTAAAGGLLFAVLPGPASAAAAHHHRATHHRGAVRSADTTVSCPWLNQSEPIEGRVSQLLSAMSLDQKIDLVEGHNSNNPYVFYEPAIPSLCIPQMGEEDGPAGVADEQTGVTQLPAGVDLAATFDKSLARQYGQVVGSEEFGKGATVNLGPTVNLDRDPRWGRSFETFSEDPYLSGQLAVGEIDGVQSTGEMSQVKHYDDYDQETNRNTAADNEIVSQRSLHELYLASFYMAVTKAQAASVMCSYASINGAYECQDPTLLNGVLKGNWDFPGFVTSDYGALHDTSGIVDGTDQEQPESTYFGSMLESEIESGQIPISVLNTSLSRIFTEMFRFDLFNAPPTGTTADTVTSPAHVATATKVANAGTTLLQNTNHLLPLSPNQAGTVAVIGPSASASPTSGGGGSAYVIPSDPVSPLAGLEAAAKGHTQLSYTQGLPTDSQLTQIPSADLSAPDTGTASGATYSATLTAPETGTYVLGLDNPCSCYAPTYLSVNGTQLLDNPGTPPHDPGSTTDTTYSAAIQLTQGQTYTISVNGASAPLTWATPSQLAPGIAQAVTAAKAATTAVVVVSDDTESEAADRPSLELPSAQDELVQAVAAANPNTVVVIDAGAPVAMPWLSQVSSVLDAWYPGQVNGTSLADVLFGKVDPGGHLPVTFPASLSQVPASTPAQFPGVNGTVQFSEGLNIGYRWYDSQNITPLFPFGYGLSYTQFAYSNLQVQPAPDPATGDTTVTATVTNTGSVAGSDVAQAYLTDPAASTEPPRQLAGFQRVSLQPGQSEQVTFMITPHQTQWWDEGAGGWNQSPGTYEVEVGDSSATANLPLQSSFTLAATPGARQVSVNAPSTMTPGAPSTVTVNLSASGTETLNRVKLALQLPQGWTAQPLTKAAFTQVAPGTALSASFQVVPAADSPDVNATVHATAKLGADSTREAGVSTSVS